MNKTWGESNRGAVVVLGVLGLGLGLLDSQTLGASARACAGTQLISGKEILIAAWFVHDLLGLLCSECVLSELQHRRT